MNRSTRTLVVVAIAALLATFSTYLVYRAIQNRPIKEVEVAQAFAVVASRPLTLGTRITAVDVKRVAWPAANPVPGGFGTVEEVLEHGVVSPIAPNEPLTANNVASKDAGVGLPPTIPEGMRAISVRVNEVIGVAGFVVPGTRVDVMVILAQGDSSLARVVVSNVQVLAAGTRYDQEVAREGKALPSSVVTLLVSPDDAELVGLAANQGQLMLTLRNPLDNQTTTTAGTRTIQLSGRPPAPVVAPPAPARARRVAAAAPAVVAPPPPPPPPMKYTVEVIRGAKRTEEVVK